MRYVGRVTQWNDDRGFGFVTPNGGGERAFVHIKSFKRRSGRPVAGMMISYELIKDDKGRFNAKDVRNATLTARKEAVPGSWRPRTIVAASFLTVLALGWILAKVAAIVALAYGVMSLVAILLYGADKSAAVNNRWRIQESTLHFVALLGGWPGALFAQDVFRHKSRKAMFQTVFWITVVFNCAALAWLLSTGRAAVIDQLILGAIAGN